LLRPCLYFLKFECHNYAFDFSLPEKLEQFFDEFHNGALLALFLCGKTKSHFHEK
jgi:hypothetical protein